MFEAPKMLQKITRIGDEELFTGFVLDKHLRGLIEECKVICIRKMSSRQKVTKIKRIMGIQSPDQTLIIFKPIQAFYWFLKPQLLRQPRAFSSLRPLENTYGQVMECGTF
ncbi:uncharacterized protein LOC129768311 [Toxorhynchites rutilus septentrionalis]|uniref:uncharacterized protein LOC129768311 n=1 Tax=Toxorhynchites rutilus septentrionalis TaxID=329112 RepID=UPI00247998F1|nr:uncharacterized protein LOC129768311 [Toxorhynchites rutilus septentrionalis]